LLSPRGNHVASQLIAPMGAHFSVAAMASRDSNFR
jgi:hypothetical protein